MPDLAQWPARVTLRWVTAAALAATLLIFTILAAYDRGLRPYSIVAFELAWAPAEASEMLGQ